MALQQVDIGEEFLKTGDDLLAERIWVRKAELADRLLVLAHHYQQESVYQFADMTGDSLKLAKHAAACQDKPYIVFCGVHFMAEAADILSKDSQAVILPDLRAGCPMADMATLEEVKWAWGELTEVTEVGRIIPVTYVNSSAAIKAFVGENVNTWAVIQRMPWVLILTKWFSGTVRKRWAATVLQQYKRPRLSSGTAIVRSICSLMSNM
jgi:quinolinate synthase